MYHLSCPYPYPEQTGFFSGTPGVRISHMAYGLHTPAYNGARARKRKRKSRVALLLLAAFVLGNNVNGKKRRGVA